MSLPGKDGLVLMRYNGGNAGTSVWTGEQTGTMYVFGMRKREQFVDRRDVQGLQQHYEGSTQLFTTVNQQAGVQSSPPPLPQLSVKAPTQKNGSLVALPNQPSVTAADILQSITEGVDAGTPDPSLMSVTEINSWLDELPEVEEVESVLEKETAGKDRKTAKRDLQKYLDGVNGS